MREAELQQMVVDLARWSGYLTMHIRDSRKSSGVGFPDLVLLHQRTGHLILAELKSETGRLTPGQQAWLAAFRVGGHTAVVWRPADWHSGEVRRALTVGVEAAA